MATTPGRAACDLQLVAYHEAGHAVIAFVHRRPVLRITIVPDPERDQFGACQFKAHPPEFYAKCELGTPSLTKVQTEIMCCLGGAAAEQIHRGSHDKVGADRDIRNAMDYADAVCRGDASQGAQLVDLLFERATERLRLHWPGVEAVARELLSRRSISGRLAKRKYVEAMQLAAHVADRRVDRSTRADGAKHMPANPCN